MIYHFGDYEQEGIFEENGFLKICAHPLEKISKYFKLIYSIDSKMTKKEKILVKTYKNISQNINFVLQLVQ